MDVLDSKQHECVFILDYMGIGGSERKIMSVANGLAKRGHKVHLIFLNQSYSLSHTFEKSIQFKVLHREGKLDLKAVKTLRNYLKTHQNIQTIWPVNLYPLLYAFLSTLKLGRQINIIGSSNTTIFDRRYEEYQMLLYVPIIRSLNCFVFGSHNQKRLWIKKYFLGQKNYQVIHNGVDIERFTLEYKHKNRQTNREKFGYTDQDIVIGMVARLATEKAQEHLIKAFEQLVQQGKEVKLILAGGGPMLEPLKILCEELEIQDRVMFTGKVEDVRPYLVCMDLFALTSVAIETFSNAALEGMAMELPVVISDISGAREMVEDDVNGYVYPPGEITQLKNSLEKLCDKQHRERLGQKARAIIEEKFTKEIMVNNYQRMIWPQL